MGRTSKAESERVRLAILRATTDLIADHGYQGLRIPDVAKKIGKTQGAIYGRFENKEALALGALRHLRDEIVLPKVMVAVSGSASAIESVERVSATIAQVADEYPKGQLMFARLAAELAAEKGPIADEVRAMFDTFWRVLRDLFARAKAEGAIEDHLDPDRLAYAVVGLPVAFATMSRMFPDDAPYAEMEAVLSGVLTRGITK